MYKKTGDLMTEYSISRATTYRIIKEMQSLGRYPASAIIGDSRRRRVDEDAFRDYWENMEQLRHPNMRKYVKPFRKEQKKNAK